MSTITVHAGVSDFGRATDVGVIHDNGDPAELCRVVARIPMDATLEEAAEKLEHLAQVVRQFDRARKDRRECLAKSAKVDL